VRLASVIVGLLLIVAASVAGEACEPQPLRPPVLNLVKPLLELRIKQNADQFTNEGVWKGESPHTPEVERRFYKLLANRSPDGDEALAFLLNVYMGEHPGEELVCEVASRGKRMLRLIDANSRCLPLTGLEPLPKYVQGSGFLPKMAKQQILRGESCGH